jgi:hypothetical protein
MVTTGLLLTEPRPTIFIMLGLQKVFFKSRMGPFTEKVVKSFGVVSNVWMIVNTVLEGSGCGRIHVSIRALALSD